MRNGLTNPFTKGFFAWAGVLCLTLGLSACAIRESSTDSGDGPRLTIKDSTEITLNFDDLTKTKYSDSGTFDLKEIRDKLTDKDINLSTIEIIGLEVSYDDATKKFLVDNEGVKFTLIIYVSVDNDTTKYKALETAGVTSGNPLSLDPDQVLFLLNQHIFGHADGFPKLVDAIKDNTKESIKVTAEMTLLDPLKTVGPLNLNLNVEVAGKGNL